MVGASEINPKQIQFKLDSVLRNDEGDRLSTGFNESRFYTRTLHLGLKERPIDVK